jgi:hypothetical protein
MINHYLNNLKQYFTHYQSSRSKKGKASQAALIVEDAAEQTTFHFDDLHRLYDQCAQHFPSNADEYYSETISTALLHGISLEQAYQQVKEKRVK